MQIADDSRRLNFGSELYLPAPGLITLAKGFLDDSGTRYFTQVKSRNGYLGVVVIWRCSAYVFTSPIECVILILQNL
jgi:hypothetical protein